MLNYVTSMCFDFYIIPLFNSLVDLKSGLTLGIVVTVKSSVLSYARTKLGTLFLG